MDRAHPANPIPLWLSWPASQPRRRERVLLWWMASDNRYRVFYGDLQSEVVSEAQWSRLVAEGEPSNISDE